MSVDPVYFANKPKDEIGEALYDKVKDWYRDVEVSGIYSRMRKSYHSYYGFNGDDHMSSEIYQSGIQGELSLMKVNHYRSLLQNMLVMTTSQRPAMDARAINADYKSLAQTVLANGLLDYYMREKRLERYLKKATEISLVFGEGYLRLEWDATAGTEYTIDPETGQMRYSGDLKFSTLTPIDVVRDLHRNDSYEDDWVIVRHLKNRYELAAKYPELKEKIFSINSVDRDEVLFLYPKMMQNTDLVPVYEFYHKSTDAVDGGRQVVFLDADIIIYDGPLPYDSIPVYRIAPGDFIGTPHGYTVGFDLLAMQDAVDTLHSTIVTNQSTFGVQNVMVPKGHDLSVSQLSGGLNLIEYDPIGQGAGKPEVLNLTYTPPEIFNFVNILVQTMETISGVNSVARGNPEANLRSGNSLALIQSMALQFNSGLQQSYTQLVEDVGTAIIDTLRDFATVPRIAMITGKNNRSELKEFKGSDLSDIDRVVVDMGNPLAKTIAGKTEIANNLLQQGLLSSPQQYLQVLQTGQLEPLINSEQSELMLIKQENEKLSDGQGVRAIATDQHALHILEHRTVLASPEARDPRNADIQRATLQHIQEHIELLKNTDPNLLALIGQQPIQSAPPEPAQGDPLTNPEAAAANANAEVLAGPLPPQTQDIASLPSLPEDPLTGQQVGFIPGTGPVGEPS